MRRLFKILLFITIVAITLTFIRLVPSRILYGYFACDCASGSCSKMFEVTNTSINVDTMTFCKDRKYGERFNMHAQLKVDTIIVDNNSKYKFTVPLIMLFDPRSIFGCPDCLDQGGTYFEFTMFGITRHFEIDKNAQPIYFRSLTQELDSSLIGISNLLTRDGR